MKKLLICLILICCSNLFAQQDPQFTLSQTNQMFFNPANIGYRNCIGATLQGRLQWLGLSGAPMAWNFGLDIPFFFGKTKQNCIGFGMIGFGDYVGPTTTGGLRFGFNYRRNKLGPGDLAIGIDMGILSRRYTGAVWITPSGQPDPGIPDPNAAGETFDMGIGIYYAGDNFYSGISCTHINGGRIEQVKVTLARHLYLNGGGFVPLGAKQKWKLNPNTNIRTDFASITFDVGLNALCFVKENHAILFGTNYRFIDAVGLNLGYAFSYKRRNSDRVGMFMIGYNFDITASRLKSFGSTSHELVLRFFFPGKDVKLQRAFF
jgi:type IX secretion system PorP/SprF family membrane protein